MPPAERPVLVAPDAFAGALRASQVAGAIGRGLERAGLAPPDLCPVADGGAGTIDVLLPALGGETVGVAVRRDDGRELRAHVALLEEGGTALVEVAASAAATTRLVGELLVAAAGTGAAVVLVAAGGGDAPDGGAGVGAVVEAAGGLGGARVVALAAGNGGLARALQAHVGAVVESGVAWILDALGFDERMRAAHAVVTGEGRLDGGTLRGRPVGEICVRARQAGVPAHAIAGEDALDPFDRRILDLQWIGEATDPAAIEAAGEALGAALRAGEA